jgi:hypothetical protein
MGIPIAIHSKDDHVSGFQSSFKVSFLLSVHLVFYGHADAIVIASAGFQSARQT